MTIKQYLLVMTIFTVVCWGGWLLVLFFIDPEATSALGVFLFYASLFFALIGTLAIVSYYFRRLFTRKYSQTEGVQISFRQAIFLSLVVVLALFLQAQQLLNWINTILLVLLVTFIEFLMLSLKKEGIIQNNSLE